MVVNELTKVFTGKVSRYILLRCYKRRDRFNLGQITTFQSGGYLIRKIYNCLLPLGKYADKQC